MEKKQRTTGGICLCVTLSLLCLGWTAWIFSNSLRPAEASSGQSAGVVDLVQRFFAFIAPNSWIANATGKDYDLLHKIVRILAHFIEFALLGALLVWCWRSYTKRWIFFLIPTALACVIPVIDELLQSFTGGRAMEFIDVLIDLAGGICGGAFALLTIWLGNKIIKKKRSKKGKKGVEYGEGELGDSPCQVQQEDVV